MRPLGVVGRDPGVDGGLRVLDAGEYAGSVKHHLRHWKASPETVSRITRDTVKDHLTPMCNTSPETTQKSLSQGGGGGGGRRLLLSCY